MSCVYIVYIWYQAIITIYKGMHDNEGTNYEIHSINTNQEYPMAHTC